MNRKGLLHVSVALLILASLVFLASLKFVQDILSSPYSSVGADKDALCNELLEDLKQIKPAGEATPRLSRVEDKEANRLKTLWEMCKLREESEEMNRRYREANTVLGRLGSNSGLLLTFATAIATIYIAYLGSKWTTTKSSSEQRLFEQKRSIDRDEYDFKLFDALSNPKSPLGRMAASAALQARLAEIQQDLAKVVDANKNGGKVDDNVETESNLKNEQEMIVRVFLSALKISRAGIDISHQIQLPPALPVPSAPSAGPQGEAGAVGPTVAQEATSLTGIYRVLSAQEHVSNPHDGSDALQIVANKAIAEAIAEATGCYSRRGPLVNERSPLIGYDMQKVDLREVYWGSQDSTEWRKGRSGFNGRGLDFFESDLSNASFRDALLDGAIFYRTTLRKTNFRGASLKDASFQDATVIDCNFSGADLHKCDLSKATLVNPKFDKTTRLDGATWPPNFIPVVT